MYKPEDLKQFTLFTGLDDAELGKIARLCQRRTVDAGVQLITPNMPAAELYLLEDPQDAVQVELPVGDASRVILHTLSRGEAFGWSALVPPYLRSATVRCINRADVVCIEGKLLQELMDSDCHLGYIVMKNFSKLSCQRMVDATIVLRHEIHQLREKLAVTGAPA